MIVFEGLFNKILTLNDSEGVQDSVPVGGHHNTKKDEKVCLLWSPYICRMSATRIDRQ